MTTSDQVSGISVSNLVKKYGEFAAVNGISFEVKKGELFGLLGPNGAGKTTTIKMLTTITRKTSGEATVAGHDIDKEPNEVRKCIGIVFQDPSLDDKLTGRENLDFHAILYKMGEKERKEKVDQVLKLVELEDKADMLVESYSGGMKRRLEIGRGLIHDPEVLFLDEPTLGLDVQTRRRMWDYIKKLNEEHGVTLVLTTHYIEEADFLCHRVAFIDHGKIVALDSPKKLKNCLGGDIVSLRVDGDKEALKTRIGKEKWVKGVSIHNGMVDLSLEEGEKHIPDIVKIAEKAKVTVTSVHFHKPSLEDVFLHFTGNTIREEEGGGRDFMRLHARKGMR